MNGRTPSIQRPSFVPFDERTATRIYQRHLPHWRQQGVTYFITFRLADSIPRAVRRQWEYERSAWLSARGITCNPSDHDVRSAVGMLSVQEQSAFHKHFNRQVQACLDRSLGACHLRRPECIALFRNCVLEGDGESHHVGDFVIMPNHVHLLVTPAEGHELTVIVKRIKGASAVDCNRVIGRSEAFWQAESYDHIVRSFEQLQQYRQYIADNPKQAGIVVPAGAQYVARWVDRWFES